MSDTPNRPMDENDAIKKMLDRLRKTVIDAPADELDETDAVSAPVAEPLTLIEEVELAAEEIEEIEEIEEAEEIQGAEEIEEIEADASPIEDALVAEPASLDETSSAEESVQEHLAEETAKDTDPTVPVYSNAFADEDFSQESEPDEDVLDDRIVSQFFTLNEEAEDAYPIPQTEEPVPVIEAETSFSGAAPVAPLADEEEEDYSSVSADDFLSALSWEGEAAPTPEAEETASDMGFLADKANASPKAPIAPIVTEIQEPSPVVQEKKEPVKNPLSFFSPSVTSADKAVTDIATESESRTQISDKEAQDLFASNRSGALGSARARYLAEDEGSAPPPVFDTPIFATEENGYAVEVEVNREAPAASPVSAVVDEPAKESAPAPNKPHEETVVETIDDGDFVDEQDDAFLSLIGKLEPQTDTASQKKARPKRETATSPFGRPASGEQLSMDIFAVEEKKPEEKTIEKLQAETPVPAAPVEMPQPSPAREAMLAPTDVQETNGEGSTLTPEAAIPFFGEMPRYSTAVPTPERTEKGEQTSARAPHRPMTFDAEEMLAPDGEDAVAEEPLEVELPPDENAPAMRGENIRPQARPKKTRSLLSVVKAFFSRLAPAAADADVLGGLYTEEAAAYHEYSSRNQMTAFARRFVSEGSLCTLRILGLAFLCTFLLALENFSLIGYRPSGVLAGRDTQVALHLLSLLLCAIASIPVFSRAWRQLFARRVTADLYPAILLVLSIVYDVLLYLLAPAEFAFFGLLPAAAALLVAIADQRKVKGDFASFRLLSSSGDKLACAVSIGGKTEAETDAVSDLPEGEKSRIVSMKKVGFTTGFFRRIILNCEDSYKNTVLLILSTVASLGISIAVGVMSASFLFAFYAFALTLSLVLPAILPLIHKIPTAMLSLRTAGQNCAVIGEVSALEYSDAAAMIFEDVEAFPAKKMRIQRIKLYHDSALDRVLYQVASLFSTVGGPLDGVFRASTAELGISEEVTLLRVEDGGLLALVDGCEISVGRGEYMLDHGIHVFYDPEDEKLLAGGKTSVMFAAEDGQLVAKFYIRYKMDEEFEKGVEALHKRGIRTLIRTFDPNLSEDLVDKISYTADLGLRVVRKEVGQQRDLAIPQLNSGIVTKTASADVLRALFACRRAVRLIRFGGVAALVLAGVGVLGTVLLTALSLLTTLTSVYFLAYQLLLALSFFLISKISV